MRKIRLRKDPPISYVHLGLLIILLTVSYILPGRLVIHIFLLTLIACIVDGIYFFYTEKKLRLYVESGIAVEKHEVFSLHVKVANKGYLPSTFLILNPVETLRLELIDKGQAEFWVGPRATTNYEIHYKAQLSGESSGGIEKGMIISFLGFFKRKLPLEMYIRVRVLPEICTIKGIEQFSQALMNAAFDVQNGVIEQQVNNGEEVGYELRPYIEGDSQRLIHWKIAAHRDIYLVRQRESSADQRTDVFLILNPLLEEQDEEKAAILQDKMMTSFVSLAYWFTGKRQTVRAGFYMKKEWQFIKLQSVEDIRGLQELLSRYHSVHLTEKIDKKLVLKNFVKVSNTYGGARVLVSAYWNDGLQSVMFGEKIKENISIIWTNEHMPEHMKGNKQIVMWQMTDDFDLERCY